MAGILAGGSKSYGAYYEGEQQFNYYSNKALLTMREKEEARRQIGVDERAAEFMQMQVDYAKTEGKIVLNQYQDETDKGFAKGFVKGTKSGVDMSFGSPLDALADQSEERAYGYVVTKWQKDREVQGIQEKATIMLDKTKVDTANLGMFDYQAQIYRMSADESRKVASLKQRQAEYESTSAGFQRGMSFISG